MGVVMEFFAESKVKARKPHRCDACMTAIEPGTEHSYMRMKYEGDFSTARNHFECREAENGLAELHGLFGGEDWLFLHDLEPEDCEWVEVNHPAAWARIEARYDHLKEPKP